MNAGPGAAPPSPGARAAWLGVAGALIATGALVIAARSGAAPERCAEGSVALGPRCCGEGQTLDAGRCAGTPSRCPAGLAPRDGGCVAEAGRVALAGGRLVIAPLDWEAAGTTAPREVEVGAFQLDTHEVTESAWRSCADAGACPPRPTAEEPGLPVRAVTAEEAARFCRHAGGRLPTRDELAFAAAGPEARRYPWGPTGLVCRRATFGIVAGPCARGALGPDAAGMRPAGRTPEGASDLAGNVAEWTAPSPEGSAEILGGSYRDEAASALRTWARRAAPAASRYEDVGFRCAYDAARRP